MTLLGFYRSMVGKKMVVAITGIILFLWLLVHMLGNLQLWAGPEQLNAYAAFLHSKPLILWIFRSVMIVVFLLHLVTTVLLFFQNLGARPVPYRVKKNVEIEYSARTMIWSGPIIFLFLLYHLMHLTFGNLHHEFTGNVYRNVVSGFSLWYVSAVYLAAVVLLGLHLKHGLWSWLQTLGLAHPRYNALRDWFAWGGALLLVAGNLSLPLGVLGGLIQ
jgi:succinate dehydrogenase / fumarate reductase cytochrome b subunit